MNKAMAESPLPTIKPASTEMITATMLFQLNFPISQRGSRHARIAETIIPMTLQTKEVINPGPPALSENPFNATNKKNILAAPKIRSERTVRMVEIMEGGLVGMFFFLFNNGFMQNV